MSAYFFAGLTILNSACLVIYLLVDPEHERKLSYLQKLTILSMYGSKTKIICIYVMTIINSIAGYVFLYFFMKIFQSTEFQDYKEDYGDIDVSKLTVMVHNIPSKMPVVEANTLLGQIFKSRFGKELESVHTVGKYDMKKLDKYYFKRNFLEERLEFHYNDVKYKTNGVEERVTVYDKNMFSKFLRLFVCCPCLCKNSIGIKRINVTDYYIDKIKFLDKEISILKSEGVASNSGLAFITFNNEDCVYETRSDFDLIKDIARNSEASKLMKIGNWFLSKAPPPSDIIWENLSNLTNFKRKMIRLMHFIIIAIMSTFLIMILVLFDKFGPTMHTIYHKEYPRFIYFTMILQYITPTILLIYNYIMVPLIVRKFIAKSLYMRKSHQEKSNLASNYIF